MASSAVSHSHGGQQLPAAAGSMMARVDRLDLVVGYLEELRHHSGGSGRSSTTATSTLSSSSPTTPRSSSRPHGCRPAEELLREAKDKGSLVERIAFLEDRVLRMEEERMELLSSGMETAEQTTPTSSGRRSTMRMMMSGSGGSGKKGKKGLKSLVKSCVRAGAKLKTKE